MYSAGGVQLVSCQSLTLKEQKGRSGTIGLNERETPLRDGDLFSFCSLLYQQFGMAAQLNGFARTQSSITPLTEGKKDIMLIDKMLPILRFNVLVFL